MPITTPTTPLLNLTPSFSLPVRGRVVGVSKLAKPTTFDYIEDHCSHFRDAWEEYYKCEEEKEWPCEPPSADEEDKCIEEAIKFYCEDYPEECE